MNLNQHTDLLQNIQHVMVAMLSEEKINNFNYQRTAELSSFSTFTVAKNNTIIDVLCYSMTILLLEWTVSS